MTQGKYVTLRMARADEIKLAYEMGLSTPYMKQAFEDEYTNGLEDFENEYERYFDSSESSLCGGMMICLGNHPIGFTTYARISYEDDWIQPGVMEIDIWMNGEENCGKGFGSDAIVTLMKYLHNKYDIHTFFGFPDKVNSRSIKACEKAGFIQVNTHEKQSALEKIFTPKCLASLKPDDQYISEEGVLMLNEYSRTK
ncbi:MAG: GNAT family N-acetyltransferase [Oscillospiraceae bacterium]|nr:GNAT family N-acetyltransferase [Oscillospiraceae bacterium]